MNILIVSETLHTGGAETFVVRLANGLLDEGHEVMLAICYDSIVSEALLGQLHPGVRRQLVHTPGLRLRQKADGLLRRLGVDRSFVYAHIEAELERIVRSFRPDVVHSHLFKPDLAVSRLRSRILHPFRHIVTIHGDYSSFYHGEAGSGILQVREKMQSVLRQSDAIVCLCEEHSRFFPEHYPAETAGKLHVIYNGYRPAGDAYLGRTKAALGLPEDAFLFGMVSRGVEKKGWARAVAAFTGADIPGAWLVLVGEGEFLDGLRAITKHPRIIFAGFSAEPVEYIQHFDVCLLPSLFAYESLPTVVIEYLYCGKPVIATDVGEICRMITAPDGSQAGRLLAFDGTDISVPEFSGAMRDLHGNPERAAGLRTTALAAFSKFEMTHCIHQYLRLYRGQ